MTTKHISRELVSSAPLDPSKLSEDMQVVYSTIGDKAFRDLIAALGGTSVYFPHIYTIFLNTRDQDIRRSYDEMLHSGVLGPQAIRRLARQHGITSRHTRCILAKGKGSTGP